MGSGVLRLEFNKVKKKYENLKPEDVTPEIFIEMLNISYKASKFDELVDLANMQIKYDLFNGDL